jgi:hypothetical protein
MPWESGCSEIILSKLDLDNSSERTCVTLIVPPLLFLCSCPMAAVGVTANIVLLDTDTLVLGC